VISVTVIATIRNEEKSIAALIESLLGQTRRPNEIVFADGGSTDGTTSIVQTYINQGAPIKLLIVSGANISQGRNAAIEQAQSDIIAATDAGVRLAPNWLEELVNPFENSSNSASTKPVDVVCGFFLPDPRSVFEVAMGATVLPALSDIKVESFLPSSRSVAFRKTAWQKVNGYPEWLDYCEDLIFDLDLKRQGLRFSFAPAALVHFRPRSSFRAFFRQYYLYARGDGKANLWTKRHVIRYLTYIIGTIALIAGFWYKILWLAVALAAVMYVYQPYRRLWPMLGKPNVLGQSSSGLSFGQRIGAISLIPMIRFVGDVAKMIGYPVGLIWRFRHKEHDVRPIHSNR
jgi:glycosyltransferase involved in cell wall biosynthesis